MNKSYINFVMIIIILLIIGCSQDTQQEIARKKIEYLDGDYNVTYTDQGIIKVWKVREGKITSVSEKGYYFFWARNEKDKEFYVQVPINRVFIEAVKD